MIQFANPGFLWGFLGLAIPLGIHLLNRKEGKLIRVGSLRHIRETSTRQFRSIKLNEVFLLILRCLLISWVVLLLSGATVSGLTGNSKWLLIEPSLMSSHEIKITMDSLQANGYEPRFLSRGFPRITEDLPTGLPDYPSLIEELGRRTFADVLVLSQSRASGFRGQRLVLPANVTWIARSTPPRDFAVYAKRTGRDSLAVRMAHAASYAMSMNLIMVPQSSGDSYFRSEGDSAEITDIDTVRVLLSYDREFATDASLMRALLSSVRLSTIDVFEWREVKTEEVNGDVEADWLIWLSESPAPRINTRVIAFKPRSGIALLVKENDNRFTITSRLNQENILDHNLSVDMLALFFPAEKENDVARAGDTRTLDERISWSTSERNLQSFQAGALMNDASVRFIAILIFITLLIERALAYKRDQ